MYKKFALTVVVLAPILAMVASAFSPQIGDPVQSTVVATPVEESAPVQEAAVSPPPPMTSTPPQISSEVVTDAPMLDPVGVDPTPVAVDAISSIDDAPVPETSSPDGEPQDSSNDDRPDNG